MNRFRVPRMKCGGCARAIRQAVSDVDPSAIVETNIEARLVTVDTLLECGVILQAIEAAGYETAED